VNLLASHLAVAGDMTICFPLQYFFIIGLGLKVNHATGYAHQHIWCLSQAGINWEGCARKGIWRKNGGMAEVGAPVNHDARPKMVTHPSSNGAQHVLVLC